MKKLLLLLLFTVSVNAQFQTVYPPISECDDNNDQFAVFDLTQLIPQILAPVNANDYSVTFFTTVVDANNNANQITNPTSYFNVQPAIQTLYIRIVNNTNSAVNFASVDIRVLPTPIANQATLQFCDTNELPIYNLSDAIPQIINGNPNVTVTFHETIVDAQNGSNAMINGYTPLIVPGTQTLFARVQNNQNSCFSITTLTLNTHNCGDPCPAPTQLTASNITETSVTVNWNNTNGSMGYIFNRICIVPLGAMPSDAFSMIVQAPLSAYTITGLSPDACYEVYVKKVCDTGSNYSPWSAPLQICMQDCVNSGNCAEALVLNAFIDSNNNGVKDNGEVDFNQGSFVYQINDSGNNLYGNSNSSTYYIFSNNPSDSYDFSFTVNSGIANYFASSTTYNNITLASGNGVTFLYFPITVIQNYIDATCYILPQNPPRPGFTYTTLITYKNNGYQTIPSGTLTFTKDSNVTITSVSESGTTTTSTGFTYNFTNLAYNEVRSITVTMQVPTIPTVNLGDFLNSSVSIQINGDVNMTNNSSALTQMIVGSYDPNDKAESHGGKIIFDDFTANDYLYYTIRFENTGTANAEFIRVEDVLNADLDENTFEMLSASHTVNTRREGNQLTWHFYNIDLPPTVTNPNGSHGYLYFRIKPNPGYAIGDVIPNTASIFFDYNPAIVTNTFTTEFVQSLSNPTFEENTIRVYPNPASDLVTVSNDNQIISAINIYDISGKRIYSVTNNMSSEINLNVASFAKGLYLLETTTIDNQKTIKKLIIR